MSTKSEDSTVTKVCSQGVLAASTPDASILGGNTPISAEDSPELSSLIFDSLRPRRGGRGSAEPAMRLTQRDRDIIELVFRCRALSGEQIQTALFTPGGTSRCQRRLTLLVKNHYVDTLPRKAANEPAIYLLGRRSGEGNRMLRGRFGDEEFRRRLTRIGSLQHLLAVNQVRVRVERACKDLGWSLQLWRTPEELSQLIRSAHLLPDAYFKIGRVVKGQERTAAFFLEAERVVKSNQVVCSKLKRYAELYYSGRYSELFGTKALRVLFVFAGETNQSNSSRVSAGVHQAKALGITIARFVGMEQLESLEPVAFLSESIWHDPGEPSPSALFTLGSGE